jgi:hypothetical protein
MFSTFGIISVQFLLPFGIISAEFHENWISPSELSRVNFLYFRIISTHGIFFHLRNYLGNHPQDAIFALRIHCSKSESAYVAERVPPLRPPTKTTVWPTMQPTSGRPEVK